MGTCRGEGSWWEVFLQCLYFSHFSISPLAKEDSSLRVLETEHTPYNSGQMRLTAISSAHGSQPREEDVTQYTKPHGLYLGRKAVGCLCPSEDEMSPGSHGTIQLACLDATWAAGTG